MRNLVIIFLLFFFASNSNGQDRKILSIPLKPQQAQKWCWAASMQMVMNYHSSGITQEILAMKRANLSLNELGYSFIITPSDMIIANCPNSTTSISTTPPPCRTKPCIKYDQYNSGISNYDGRLGSKQDYNTLFSIYNFNSTQDAKPIDAKIEGIIINQIDKCRPIIILEGENKMAAQQNTHSVVAVGYFKNVGTQPQNLFAIHDPWSCNVGESYLVNKSYLKFSRTSHSGGSTTRKIISVVRDIFPESTAECANCTGKTDYERPTIFDELKELFINPNIAHSTEIDIHSISLESLLRIKIKPFENNFQFLNKSKTYKITLKDITKIKVNDNEVYYYYKNSSENYELMKVSKTIPFDYKPIIKINNKEITLSNNGDGVKFDIIEFPIDNLHFYRIVDNKNWYLIPTENYNFGNLLLEEKKAYDEGKVLKILQNSLITPKLKAFFFNKNVKKISSKLNKQIILNK